MYYGNIITTKWGYTKYKMIKITKFMLWQFISIETIFCKII